MHLCTLPPPTCQGPAPADPRCYVAQVGGSVVGGAFGLGVTYLAFLAGGSVYQGSVARAACFMCLVRMAALAPPPAAVVASRHPCDAAAAWQRLRPASLLLTASGRLAAAATGVHPVAACGAHPAAVDRRTAEPLRHPCPPQAGVFMTITTAYRFRYTQWKVTWVFLQV